MRGCVCVCVSCFADMGGGFTSSWSNQTWSRQKSAGLQVKNRGDNLSAHCGFSLSVLSSLWQSLKDSDHRISKIQTWCKFRNESHPVSIIKTNKKGFKLWKKRCFFFLWIWTVWLLSFTWVITGQSIEANPFTHLVISHRLIQFCLHGN